MTPIEGPRSTRPVQSTGRFARFLIVGGSGVIVNLGALLLLVEGLRLAPVLAAPLAIETSILTNYTLNRLWTWRDRGPIAFSVGRYHAVSLVGMLIQWVCIALGVHVLGVHYLVAALAGIGIAVGWTFLANDRFTFRGAGSRPAVPRVYVYAAALLLHLVVAVLLTQPWDTPVFQRAAGEFLAAGGLPYPSGAEAAGLTIWGLHIPIHMYGYAYPPLPLILLSFTYWPAVVFDVGPALARVLIKLPAILGTLGLAYAAHRFVATGAPAAGAGKSGDPADARRIENLLLFNPLFVLVAAVWGQMEAILALLLVLSILVLRSGRWATSGLLWGLAVLIKPFPLVVAPLLGVHLWRRGGQHAALRFFAAGSAVVAVVSLPFLLLAPGGFLGQTVFMHALRPPDRFAPLAAVYEALRHAAGLWPGLVPPAETVAVAVGIISLALTLLVVLLLAAASLRRPAAEMDLLFLMGATMLAVLLTGKVLNEQYMVIPVALLAVWWAHPGRVDAAGASVPRFLFLASWGLAVAALFAESAFFDLVPADVAATAAGAAVIGFLRAAAALTFGAALWHVLSDLFALAWLVAILAAALGVVLPLMREGVRWLRGRRPAPVGAPASAHASVAGPDKEAAPVALRE